VPDTYGDPGNVEPLHDVHNLWPDARALGVRRRWRHEFYSRPAAGRPGRADTDADSYADPYASTPAPDR
jgi:hypothetical protein